MKKNVILFSLIMLNLCQFYNTRDYNIRRGIRLGFKVLKMRINIVFGRY